MFPIPIMHADDEVQTRNTLELEKAKRNDRWWERNVAEVSRCPTIQEEAAAGRLTKSFNRWEVFQERSDKPPKYETTKPAEAS